MKKLVVFILSLMMISCSLSDDSDIATYEFLPIENVIMPTEFERNEVYEIRLSYLRPTSCHVFNDILFESHLNERTVAIIEAFFNGPDSCYELNELKEVTISFKATTEDLYVFKFWQGKDDNGEDQYLVVEVPVID